MSIEANQRLKNASLHIRISIVYGMRLPFTSRPAKQTKPGAYQKIVGRLRYRHANIARTNGPREPIDGLIGGTLLVDVDAEVPHTSGIQLGTGPIDAGLDI